MKRFFYSLIALFISFCSIHASTNETENFNPKNYIYDDNGHPIFIKIYIETLKTSSSGENEYAVSHSLQKGGLQMLNLMTQNDHRGGYIAIPIKKKNKNKNDDDDKDENVWICPICERENPAYRNTCQWTDCPLNRKGMRERDGW
jgi:hypothetical protein